MSRQLNRNQELEERLMALEDKVWKIEAHLSSQYEEDYDLEPI